MAIKIKEMKKGKGYITSKQTSSYKSVSFGDPFTKEAVGQWESTAALDEWDYGKWQFPNPIKGKKT